MAKLTVKNVGPIREAELEVKKHTVFIGPQGSGKSTLAKLIAIGGDSKFGRPNEQNFNTLISDYTLTNYINKKSFFSVQHSTYKVAYDKNIQFSFTDYGQQIVDTYRSAFSKENIAYDKIMPLNEFRNNTAHNYPNVYEGNTQAHSLHFYEQVLPTILQNYSLLIPTERHVFPILSDSIWSLLDASINLPQLVKRFGREFERARNGQDQLQIPFLKIRYSYENGTDRVYYSDGKSIELSQSASGYQSIIPLFLVVEYQRRKFSRRFIIEEPELNLYPIAQKDLIYSLIGGLEPDASYQEAEWVFTTHSPYILTSLNTLMLAYKVAQRSDDLKEEVKKIIPERCWINPDEFAAYYVDNGTVESITNPDTGLINDSRLDDVSDDFAGEQDKLFALYRTALVND